jgi:hypothetical protein
LLTLSPAVYQIGGGAGITSIAKRRAVDASGNIYTVGYTSSSTFATQFSVGTMTGTVSALDVVVTKFDVYGNPLWVRQYGLGDTEGNGIASDTNGNIWVGGFSTSSLVPYGIQLGSHSTGKDIFISKFN